MDFSSIDDGEGCARRVHELWERVSVLNAAVESEQALCLRVKWY